MDGIKFHWIGWCQEGTSDKVWGFCSTSGASQCYVFWGRRGRALSFKKSTKWDADSLGFKKQDRGYRSVTEARLREVWTTFDDDLQSRLCFAILADRVR
jgi:hypothetical protein